MKKYTDTYRKNRVPEYGMDAASSDVSTGGASDRKSGSQYSGSKSMQSLKDCGRTEKTSKKGQASMKSGAQNPTAYGMKSSAAYGMGDSMTSKYGDPSTSGVKSGVKSGMKSGMSSKKSVRATDSTDPEKTGDKCDNTREGSFTDCR